MDMCVWPYLVAHDGSHQPQHDGTGSPLSPSGMKDEPLIQSIYHQTLQGSYIHRLSAIVAALRFQSEK